jgi:CheY-like chemotaxis protein
VKQSGGHIKIYSEEGQGTTIKIYLRRITKRATEEQTEIAEDSGAGEQGETILVVEDDGDLRVYITEVLRELKYRVLSAANPQAALTMLKQNGRVDLLLTDIVMPGQNGRELATAAQALRPNLHVLFMTGYSRNAVVHHGRLEEGVELLQKPISQAELARRVREVLERRR